MAGRKDTHWADYEIEKLISLWLNGFSFARIGRAMPERGKSACQGKMWRIAQENPELYELKKKMKEERQEEEEKEKKEKAKKPKPRKKRTVRKTDRTDRPAIYHGQKHSMCWLCQHAAFDCKKPVDGWKVGKKTVRFYNRKKELRMYETVVVKKCPNFEPDPWVDRIDPYERQKYYSN